MVFLSQFVSYLIVVIASMGIIVLAVFLGKKWRDAKEQKDRMKLEAVVEADQETIEAQAEEF